MTHAINLVILIIMTLAGLVMTVISFIDGLLAGLMTSVGIPPNVQIILLAAAAIALVVMAVRALGGLFATLIAVLLLLLLLHLADPGLGMPQGHVPTWLNPPAQPHTAS
jgi:hypothetical protein